MQSLVLHALENLERETRAAAPKAPARRDSAGYAGV